MEVLLQWLDLQFVNDGFDLLELGSLVGVSIPADVDDPLQVVVDRAGDDWPGQVLRHLVCVCVCVCVRERERERERGRVSECMFACVL